MIFFHRWLSESEFFIFIFCWKNLCIIYFFFPTTNYSHIHLQCTCMYTVFLQNFINVQINWIIWMYHSVRGRGSLCHQCIYRGILIFNSKYHYNHDQHSFLFHYHAFFFELIKYFFPSNNRFNLTISFSIESKNKNENE